MTAFIIGRTSITGKNCFNKRRTIPTDGKHQVRPCTQCDSLGTNTLLYGRIVGHAVDDGVGIIYYGIESLVGVLDYLVLISVTEFVNLGTEVIVTIHVTCCEHIVTGFIEEHGKSHIDTLVTGNVISEALIEIIKGILRIGVGLIEIVGRYYAFLLDVKPVLASAEEHCRAEGQNGI